MTVLFSGLILLILGIAITKTVGGGAFFYSLDDPYIHLALARQIQSGSYGINPGEWAAPSSSILWPFLLALSPRAWLEWAPLVLNVAASLVSVQVLRASMKDSGMPVWAQNLCAITVAFGLNLFGLVFTGMEHSLQVMFVCILARKLVTNQRDVWFFLALIVAPWLRYECLAITVPIAAWLISERLDRGRVLAAMGVSFGVILGFSLFLHHQGQAWLPSSVLAKSEGLHIAENIKAHSIIFAVVVLLGYLHWSSLKRWLCWVVLPVTGFLIGGRVGWFGRYEVFILAWLTILLLHAVVSLHREQINAFARQRTAAAVVMSSLAIILSFSSLWRCTLETPLAARNIAEQQGFMSVIAKQLGQPVAVNDLGLVALRSGQYVLDLWGLGSYEALKARRSGVPADVWMDDMMRRKHVHFAFLTEVWFPKRPAGWIKVGDIVLKGRRVAVPESRVGLFATDEQAAVELRQTLIGLAENPQLKPMVELR